MIVDSPGVGESDVMSEFVLSYLPRAFCFMYVLNSNNAGGIHDDRVRACKVEYLVRISCISSATIKMRMLTRRAGMMQGRERTLV